MTRLSLILATALFASCGSSEGATEATAPVPEPETPAQEHEAPAPTPRGAQEASTQMASAQMDVEDWQAVLDAYVTEDGGFRYAALKESDEGRAQLAATAQQIASARPEGWSRDAKLAFYINAYNALTVKAVVDAWPMESVMRVDGFFDANEHTVAGQEMTLNHLENEIIRSEQFAEPRIHFAVNCASAGCPRLSQTAYTPENLEEQLETRARTFVRRTTRLEGDRVLMSQIFEWFASDFEPAGGARAFVAERLERDRAARVRDEGTTISHFEYDWAVNARD